MAQSSSFADKNEKDNYFQSKNSLEEEKNNH